LIRFAKKYVVIRTIFGEINYIIKEVRNPNDIMKNPQKGKKILIAQNGEPLLYNFFNMYTEQYFKDIITEINKNIEIKIIKDNEFTQFDNRKLGGKSATRIMDGRQVSGNFLLDWRFIILKK